MIPYAEWLVWVTPLVSSLFVPLIAKFSTKARDYYAVLMSALTTVIAVSLALDIYFGNAKSIEYSIPWIPAIGVNAGVLIDPLSVLFANMIAFFGCVIILYSLGYMAKEEGLTRYYFFMLLFVGSMIGLVISDNFLQLFVFWEMVGLCSYSLISFWHNRPESVRAAIKVFLTTRLGDISLLAAIGVVYASFGSLSFSYAITHASSLPLPNLGAIAFLILGAAIAKSAQLPLHTWLFSAMEAPTSVSALLHSATMVKAGIYLIARLITLFGPLLVLVPTFLPIVAWVGVLTAFMGATLALYTADIKGVLAYSTISQLGFMMAALGTVSSASSLGWFASLFHMVSHAFFEGLGFLIAGGIIHAVGTRDMRLMGGLRKDMPTTFGLSIVFLLTSVGMLPFAGFFSKGLVITSLSLTGNLWWVLLIYLSTAFTFAYSLRFFIMVFLRKKAGYLTDHHVHEPPGVMLVASYTLAVFCLVWGFLGPVIGNFMQVTVEIDWLGSIFSLETVVILGIFLLGGVPIYLLYFKDNLAERVSRLLSPIATVLKHGYFFDDLYERVIAQSVWVASKGVRSFEMSVFDRMPQLVARGVIGIAHATHVYLDLLADELLYVVAHRTLGTASRIQRTHHTGSLQHYIAAAIIGFILIIVLTILTLLRGGV